MVTSLLPEKMSYKKKKIRNNLVKPKGFSFHLKSKHAFSKIVQEYLYVNMSLLLTTMIKTVFNSF